MEPTASATLTVTYTVTVKPEPLLTAEDKEANIKQQVKDQAAALVSVFDWGISLEGEVSSSVSETEALEGSKPDYVEED